MNEKLKLIFIARICQQTIKAYCESLGDYSQKNWEECGAKQRDSILKGVQFKLENSLSSAKDQHENWCKDKVRDGWIYGKIKDPAEKTHPCLVEYDKLPIEQRHKDGLFQAIVEEFRYV